MFTETTIVLKKNTPLIVAVSGGPDSMALMHLLLEQGFKNLIIAHVDHRLRIESRDEARMVEQSSSRNKLKFELLSVDIKKLSKKIKRGVEETGRIERYRFFEKLRKKYKAKYIVTAHHRDDLIETVLLNMTRGCGVSGLVGMDEVSENLWRPLLQCSKHELMEYCKKRKIPFATDASNADTEYSRNFIRHKIIPEFQQLNPNFLNTFAGNIALWSSAEKFIAESAEEYLFDQSHNAYHLSTFFTLHPFVRQEVIRKIYLNHHGNLNDFSQSHLAQIMSILSQRTSGKKKEFGRGKIIVKRKGYFTVDRSELGNRSESTNESE